MANSQSQSGILNDRNLNILVSLGAAVVIFGAWAKILHKPFADIMLTIGLLTEAAIFLLYAIQAYQNKSGSHSEEVSPVDLPAGLSNSFKTLSDNLSKLDQSVSQIRDLSNMQAATADYTQKTKDASAALDAMRTAYQQAANSVSSFGSATEGSLKFHDQIQKLTQNLGSLNTMYETELKDTNNHLRAMNAFYGNLVKASESMAGSVDDAKKTQEQIAQLSKNLTSLNAVYGNMLAAMQGR